MVNYCLLGWDVFQSLTAWTRLCLFPLMPFSCCFLCGASEQAGSVEASVSSNIHLDPRVLWAPGREAALSSHLLSWQIHVCVGANLSCYSTLKSGSGKHAVCQVEVRCQCAANTSRQSTELHLNMFLVQLHDQSLKHPCNLIPNVFLCMKQFHKQSFQPDSIIISVIFQIMTEALG